MLLQTAVQQAALLYEKGLATKPELAQDLRKGYHSQAAFAAGLAGCAQGQDADQLDNTSRARWRHQALRWLQADLKLLAASLEKPTREARTSVAMTIQTWKMEVSLARLRETWGLATLPEAEAEAWRRFWADADRVQAQAQGSN